MIPLMKQAKVSALLLPASAPSTTCAWRDLGVHTIRVATHCTEADDVSAHRKAARWTWTPSAF